MKVSETRQDFIVMSRNVVEKEKGINFLFIGDVRRSNREFQKGWRENGNSEGGGGGDWPKYPSLKA